MKVALFDFDGTIYPYETFNILMEKLKTHPEYKKPYRVFMTKFLPVYTAYKLNIISKMFMQKKAMELYMLSFKGRSKAEIEDFFAKAAAGMAEDLRTSLIEEIKDLKQKNYYTVLISGAYVPLLEALFDKEHFDCIIGTEVHYSGGAYNYKEGVRRVHAEGKIDSIKQHFHDKHIDWNESCAYSDSYTDLKMLELVGHPVAVTPDSKLLETAQSNNWRIYSESNGGSL